MKKLTIALTLAVSSVALAQDPRGRPNEPGYTIPGGNEGRAARPMEPGQSFRGEVQGIDKIAGRITLKHDSIQAFGLPAGSMDYEVKDSSLLEHIKVGDHVRFSAVMQRRSLLVTNIAPAN